MLEDSEARSNGCTLVLCDLDGTLILENSFHIFIRECFKGAGIFQAFRFLSAVASRLFRKHEHMKKQILDIFGRQPDEWKERVVDRVVRRADRFVSRPVLEVLMNAQAEGADMYLVTAAPSVYAERIASRYGMKCIATPSDVSQNWSELLSWRKVEAVRNVMEGQSYAKVVVLTDHIDDLPLLSIASEGYIQGSIIDFDRIVRRTSLHPDALCHLDSDCSEPDGGIWLWLNDEPHGPYDEWEVRTVVSKHRYALGFLGNGKWAIVRPGRAWPAFRNRRNLPMPPRKVVRICIGLQRKLVRDILGLYH